MPQQLLQPGVARGDVVHPQDAGVLDDGGARARLGDRSGGSAYGRGGDRGRWGRPFRQALEDHRLRGNAAFCPRAAGGERRRVGAQADLAPAPGVRRRAGSRQAGGGAGGDAGRGRPQPEVGERLAEETAELRIGRQAAGGISGQGVAQNLGEPRHVLDPDADRGRQADLRGARGRERRPEELAGEGGEVAAIGEIAHRRREAEEVGAGPEDRRAETEELDLLAHRLGHDDHVVELEVAVRPAGLGKRFEGLRDAQQEGEDAGRRRAGRLGERRSPEVGGDEIGAAGRGEAGVDDVGETGMGESG